MTPIALDVFADIACPWCFIGHRRLQAVLAGGAAPAFAVRHRAFKLQPRLPPRGRPMRDYLAEQFGCPRTPRTTAGVAAEARRTGNRPTTRRR